MFGGGGGALAALQFVAGAESAGHARAGLRAREGDALANKARPFSQKAPLVGAALVAAQVALRRVFVASRAAGPFIESNAN